MNVSSRWAAGLLGLLALCVLGIIGVVMFVPGWTTHLVTAASMVIGTALMSPRDVGRLLNLSASRVIQLEKEGQLPAERDSSGRRFFQRVVVEQFAIARAAQAATASRSREGRFATPSTTPLVIVSRATGQDDHLQCQRQNSGEEQDETEHNNPNRPADTARL